MKFKVGDKVKGISNDYIFTGKDMYLGEVTKVGLDEIEIKILEHKNNYYVGKIYSALFPDGRFEIVKKNLTISQLQSEIDKLSNKVQKEYSEVISNRDKVNYLKKQLGELIKESKKEENKSILDDEEKEYLRGVIKPFKNRIKYINLEKLCNKDDIVYMVFHLKSSDSMILPRFKKGTMYKNMEVNKEYTLEELGLDE